MNKKIFLFTIAAAISLAGCGGGSGSGSSMSSSSVVSSSIQMSSANEVSSSSEISSSDQMSSASEVSLSSAINTSSLPSSADAVSSSSVMSSANQTSSVIVVVPSSSMNSSSQAISSSEAALSSAVSSIWLSSSVMSSSSQSSTLSADVPLPVPTYGFNLGNSLEAIWGYAYPSQAVFTTAANAGFNAVRIPCAWDSNANQTTYQIDPAYMAKVKQAVDYAIAAGLYVVINVHWDGGSDNIGWLENSITEEVDPTITAKMDSYWTQIATVFAGYDNRLLFAGANEPNVHNPAEMATLMSYYQTFINAVRAVGGNNTNRWLVLSSVSAPSWMNSLPTDPTPNRLMVEYHNYTPSLFTIIHSDQSWGNAIHFWGEAYHYAGSPTRNSPKGWEEGIIDSAYQELTDQYVSKGIPVMIGEFHAARVSGLTGDAAAYNRASVNYWNKYALDSAHAHGLSPFYWSTPNAPFEYSTGAITDADTVRVLTGGEALPPPNGAPYAASNLVATNTGAGEISLSWNAATNATSYKVYRAAESGYESEIAPVATGISGTSYTDAGLNEGTTYYYQVVAVNSNGVSGFSKEAKATTPGVNPDPTKLHFETDPQRAAISWVANGTGFSFATSSALSYAGNQSLAVNFSGGTGGNSGLKWSGVVVPAGATITFRVWIPSNSTVTAVDLFLQDSNWNWFDTKYQSLTPNTWNTITLTVPANATTPLNTLGVQFTTSAAWTGTLYIDSIDW